MSGQSKAEIKLELDRILLETSNEIGEIVCMESVIQFMNLFRRKLGNSKLDPGNFQSLLSHVVRLIPFVNEHNYVRILEEFIPNVAIFAGLEMEIPVKFLEQDTLLVVEKNCTFDQFQDKIETFFGIPKKQQVMVFYYGNNEHENRGMGESLEGFFEDLLSDPSSRVRLSRSVDPQLETHC